MPADEKKKKKDRETVREGQQVYEMQENEQRAPPSGGRRYNRLFTPKHSNRFPF